MRKSGYQSLSAVILNAMSPHQRLRRSACAWLSATSGVVFAVLLVACSGHRFADQHQHALAALWLSGIAALALRVLASSVGDDSTEHPRYLGSVVRGLRQEWKRSRRTI